MPRRGEQHEHPSLRPATGRLAARPLAPGPVPEPPPPAPGHGLHPLGLAAERDGLLYVPPGYDPARPAPLVVLLHGAGADARDILPVLRGHADALGFLVLAPDARRQTWDAILGRPGPDVAFLDAALGEAFARYAIDPARVAVGGFSDGASYALTLGLGNGDLFAHVLAFSPGFMAPKQHRGAPRVFVSHGTNDRVLPITSCSRRIVPQLEGAGYDVRYVEFSGGHAVPAHVTREAIDWWLPSAPAPHPARRASGLTA